MSDFNDVIVGEGNRGNSAVRVFEIPGEHSISQNYNSYWINDVYLDIGMTIFKDTPEGRELTNKIVSKADLKKINSWLENVCIEHVSRTMLKQKIKQALARSYDDGSRARAAVIRGALGI